MITLTQLSEQQRVTVTLSKENGIGTPVYINSENEETCLKLAEAWIAVDKKNTAILRRDNFKEYAIRQK